MKLKPELEKLRAKKLKQLKSVYKKDTEIPVKHSLKFIEEHNGNLLPLRTDSSKKWLILTLIKSKEFEVINCYINFNYKFLLKFFAGFVDNIIMIKSTFFIVSLLLMTTACSPVYNTNYTYTRPDSIDGSICLNQCISIQQVCINDENMSREMCLSRLSDNLYAGLICRVNYDRCLANYNSCYINCGGQVISNTYCVRYCANKNKY